MPRPKAKPRLSSTPLPQSFTTKKSQILQAISIPLEEYSDKSPKGSIDAPIINLINELNTIEGLVTTSSCSGRVAVFVEGPKATLSSSGQDTADVMDDDAKAEVVTGSAAGKGGGKWLFVSHDPVVVPEPLPEGYYTRLCGLTRSRNSRASVGEGNLSASMPRFVKLSFSPLILHVFCATLAHAKPLLAAAVNAGFRESGVHSLKALDDVEAGVMVGIRTMGLGFETVVGVLRESGRGEKEDVYEAIVSEEYLEMMFQVVHERFQWNDKRRGRLVDEVRTAFGGKVWEDKEERARRMKEEGLRRRKQLQESGPDKNRVVHRTIDGGGDHLEKQSTDVLSPMDDYQNSGINLLNENN